jgi:mRNA interferase MazF
MVRRRGAPRRGDLIWLSLEPHEGHEQAGRRPALVLSPAAYNARTGFALCCPVTSRVKGYPFEVALPAGLPITGVVLADQVRTLDWTARRAEVAAAVPPGVVSEALGKLTALLS